MNKRTLKKLFCLVLSFALILPMFENSGQIRAASKYRAYIEMITEEDGYTELYQSQNITISADGQYTIKLGGLHFSEEQMWTLTIKSLRVVTTIPCEMAIISDVHILFDDSEEPLTTNVTSTSDGEYIAVDVTNVDNEVDYLPDGEISIGFTLSDLEDYDELEKYLLSYSANGAAHKPKSQYFTEDESVRISSESPQKAGAVFLGWSLVPNSDKADYSPGDKVTFHRDVTLYAVWEEVVSGDSNIIKNGTIIKTGTAKYVVTDKNKKIVSFEKPISKSTKTIVIPKSIRYKGISYTVKGMQSHAFYNCKKLKSVVIQANVSEIPAYAFYNCTSLTKLKFPNTVIKIGAMSFKNCKSLTTLSLGKVSKIAGDAFVGCVKLHFTGNLSKNVERYAVKYGFYKLPKPQITKRQENGFLIIEWGKVKNAQEYEVYRRVGDGGYEKLTTGTADNTSINIPVSGIQSGSYGIKIRALYKTEDGKTVYSSYSNEIEFTQ